MLDSAPKSNDVISHHRDNSKGVICNYFANKIRIPHHGLGDLGFCYYSETTEN